MFNLKKIVLPIILIALFVGNVGFGMVQEKDYGLEAANTAAYGGSGATITDLPSGIGKVVGTILSLVGVIFFILMIYGGFVWMFARGNDQDVKRAKEIIESAIIGIIIVLAAYAITAYIGGALTS